MKQLAKKASGERCQKFYNEPASCLPSCEKLDKSESKVLYETLKYFGSLFDLFCAENRTCQLAKEIRIKTTKMKGSNIQYSELSSPSELVFKNDCHHKECVDKSIAFYETQIEIMEVSTLSSTEIEKVKAGANKSVERYRSQSCTKLIGQSNDATEMNASNILLFTIIIFI